ncbi:NTP transferase domain-containing protein [Dactylosporangium sp. AC04546]|nr:NTP transferase domain-containing protein [Dactylosporangium sp. AC04546]WVK89412.1 NTP transferase domain-containing protein [Dactylosporangium sp. AC04546]
MAPPGGAAGAAGGASGLGGGASGVGGVAGAPGGAAYADRGNLAPPGGAAYADRGNPAPPGGAAYADRGNPAPPGGAAYADRGNPAPPGGAAYADRGNPAPPGGLAGAAGGDLAAAGVRGGEAPAGRWIDVPVRTVQEEPARGGPVAGLGAGLAALAGRADVVLVLAADLPRLDSAAVRRLVGSLGEYDGALFVDQDGRRQLLCGAWRVGALQQALRRIGSLDGVAMRRLVDGLAINEVRWDESGIPPYFDCDTDEDLRRVHE